MNAFSQAAGVAAMRAYEYMRDSVEKVRATRERLRDRLIEMGFNVPRSQANFLLAQWAGTPQASEIFSALRERGILVRYFAQPRLENALRISIGSDSETDALITALQDILELKNQ